MTRENKEKLLSFDCMSIVEGRCSIDHLRNRQNFDLNKSRQIFHHILKEHHKISNIPNFGCVML